MVLHHTVIVSFAAVIYGSILDSLCIGSVHLASDVAIVVVVMISSLFMYCLGPSNVVML